MKRTKILILVLLALACALLCALALTACKDEKEETDHDWGDWYVAVEPDCQTAGVKMRVCKLNSSHFETEPIALADHKWDEGEVAKEADCENDGEMLYTCQTNPEHTRTEVIDKLGHKWDEGEVAKNADCENDGEMLYTCKNNVKHTKTEVIVMLGHDWDDGVEVTKQDCTHDGVILYTCKNDDSHTTKDVFPKLGHVIPEESEGVSNDYYTHDVDCERCGLLASGKHSFDTDNNCTVCGYQIVQTAGITFEIKSDSTVTVTKIPDKDEVVIPYYYSGLPVTCIGDSAAKNCSVESIYLPDSITEIEIYAFSNCRYLKSIVLPDQLKAIYGYTFEKCSNLTTVKIGKSVELIQAFAFCDCPISEVHADSFAAWCNMSRRTNDGLSPESGQNLYIDGKLIEGDLVIPNYVDYIGNSVFCNNKLITSVTIPKTVTTIAASAFRDCTNLASVTIPDSVFPMGANAFTNTAYYNNEDNWKDSALYIGRHLIEVKKSFSGVFTVKAGTLTIGGFAFNQDQRINTGLTGVILPDGLISIGQSAFRNCVNLKSLNIPASVFRLGTSITMGCIGLESLTVADGNLIYHSAGNCIIETDSKNLVAGCKSSVIPDDGSVISIATFAFADLPGFDEFVIPDSIIYIGETVFSGCPIKKLYLGKGIKSIGARALSGINGEGTRAEIYYGGTRAEWEQIDIHYSNNEYLENATIHYADD